MNHGMRFKAARGQSGNAIQGGGGGALQIVLFFRHLFLLVQRLMRRGEKAFNIFFFLRQFDEIVQPFACGGDIDIDLFFLHIGFEFFPFAEHFFQSFLRFFLRRCSVFAFFERIFAVLHGFLHPFSQRGLKRGGLRGHFEAFGQRIECFFLCPQAFYGFSKRFLGLCQGVGFFG